MSGRLRIAAAIAPMNAKPKVRTHQVSQQLAGHDVDALETNGDWIRVRSADDYTGWIHTGFLEPASDQDDASPTRLVSLGSTVERVNGDRRVLPLRAFVRHDERVVAGEAVDAETLRARFPLTGTAVAESARDLFRGTSYVWGGVTPWGADCSGLVQSIFALHGRQLPRDAWQQATVGDEVTGTFADLQSADLLFFSDRPDKRVTHVSVSLGASQIVHLAIGRGGYARENLDSDDRYVAGLRTRFLFARRVI